MSIRRIVARQIADGTGGEFYAGRITADNGMVVKIERGDYAPDSGDIFIDEAELLTPAFIDAHGHSDISLMAMPGADGKTAQGIAYEVSGNCGLTPFPLTEYNRSHLQELYRQYDIKLDWSNCVSYRARLAEYAPALELFPLVGHNSLRAAVAGYEEKVLSAEQLDNMCRILARELSGGCIGLSFGLLYTPGCFAGEAEIIQLMHVVESAGKICTVHLESEGARLAESIDFMLNCARSAGLKKLHLSHLKTAGKSNFHKLPAISAALESKDLRVTGDIYCYGAAMTQLSVILPAPFDSYDDVKIMTLLKNSDTFAEVLHKVRQERSADYWQNVEIINAGDNFRQFENLRLNRAASLAGRSPEELFLEILKDNAVGAAAAFHTLSTENMRCLAAHRNVVPGSDESARSCTEKYGRSHPRGFGNHARYFNLRREQGAEIAEIIRQMSLVPAEIFNLQNIGSISVGKRAVFTALDTAVYADRATFAEPHKLAGGARLLRWQ